MSDLRYINRSVPYHANHENSFGSQVILKRVLNWMIAPPCCIKLFHFFFNFENGHKYFLSVWDGSGLRVGEDRKWAI